MASLTISRPTVARVDARALADNLRAIAAHVGTRCAELRRPAPRIIAVVKANAYGHGAVQAALAFEAAGAAMLACADIEEGVSLRDGGVRAPILVFGAVTGSDLAAVFTHRLTPTVSGPAAASALERAAAERDVRLPCHLQIDTGMHRLGFRHENVSRTLPPILASPHLAIEAVYTHFATAEDVTHPLFDEQVRRFAAVRASWAALGPGRPAWHAANSAACFRDEHTWFDYVRPGLALYGVTPPPLEAPVALEPALTLVSCVSAVKDLRAGDSVGYGARYVAPGPRRIAIVPAGYADGLDVRLAGRGHVLIRGRRAPVVGSVCMDMITVDCTEGPVEPGDEVVLLGGQGRERIGVGQIAAAIGTIPYELLCRLGTRIARAYVERESAS